MKMDRTQDCDEVVSSTGRCHWHQVHAQSRINVSCDAVKARHANRTSSLVRTVPDPPLPVALEDVVRWEGRRGAWSQPRHDGGGISSTRRAV